MLELDTVYCGDCLEIMSRIPDESVDLVFADPPFNIGKPYKDRRDDYQDWCAKWIAQCFRVLKDTGSFYHMTLTRHLEWKMPLMAQYGVFMNLISWRNVSASHSKRSFWNEYQPIMVYGKTQDYKFNTYAEVDMTPLTDCVQYHKRWRWGGYSTTYRGQLKDRWDDIPFVYAGSIHHPEAIIVAGTNKKAHPCQMPLGIVRRVILFSSDENDIVLDPFLGSGTTAVAAEELGRRWMGIELSSEYCTLAENRIAEARRQLKLEF